jgi:hypothetical protein
MNPRSRLNRRTYSGDAGPVSSDTRHVPPLSPASIAIHNDGYMFGKLCRIHMPVDFCFSAIEAVRHFVLQSGHRKRLPQQGSYWQ